MESVFAPLTAREMDVLMDVLGRSGDRIAWGLGTQTEACASTWARRRGWRWGELRDANADAYRRWSPIEGEAAAIGAELWGLRHWGDPDRFARKCWGGG